MPQKGKGNIARRDEGDYTHAYPVVTANYSPDEAYESREKQWFDHDPQEADVVAPETGYQFAHDQSLDDLYLNMEALRETCHCLAFWGMLADADRKHPADQVNTQRSEDYRQNAL